MLQQGQMPGSRRIVADMTLVPVLYGYSCDATDVSDESALCRNRAFTGVAIGSLAGAAADGEAEACRRCFGMDSPNQNPCRFNFMPR